MSTTTTFGCFDPKKEADDGTWTKYKDKGRLLVEAMKGTDSVAGQVLGESYAESEFKGDMTQEFTKWGYTEGTVNHDLCNFEAYWKVGKACGALGLNPYPQYRGGHSIGYSIHHFDPRKRVQNGKVSSQLYKVGDKDYRATGTSLELAINPVGGVIFQQGVLSIEEAARTNWSRTPSPEELPKLRRLSDIMWGLWNRDSTDNSNIRYFWVQDAENAVTQALIAKALKGVGGVGLDQWPGKTFSMDDDAGKALLASPNAACFAYFLLQHKAELGRKTIDQVTVFKSDMPGYRQPDLVFRVAALDS